MNKNSETSFSDFKNFEFGDNNPKLPLEKAAEINQGEIEMHHGAFTTTIEIDNDNIVKLNRLIRTSLVKEDENSDTPELKLRDTIAKEYLSPKTDDKESVVKKMLELAKNKLQTYEALGSYLGDYLPELKFFAVVDSPRKQLENDALLGQYMELKQLDPSILNQLPETETTLMEVWENIDPNNRLERGSFNDMYSLYNTEEFREQQKGFAQATYQMLIKTGMMLDICDGRGIRVIRENDTRVVVRDASQVRRLIEDTNDHALAIPRNMAYSKGKLVYYDTYPIDTVSEYVDQNTFNKLLDLYKNKAWKEIYEEVDESIETKAKKLSILRYAALLEKMGAEL